MQNTSPNSFDHDDNRARRVSLVLSGWEIRLSALCRSYFSMPLIHSRRKIGLGTSRRALPSLRFKRIQLFHAQAVAQKNEIKLVHFEKFYRFVCSRRNDFRVGPAKYPGSCCKKGVILRNCEYRGHSLSLIGAKLLRWRECQRVDGACSGLYAQLGPNVW